MQVTLIAEHWYNKTTSDGAAGAFRPDHVLANNPADIPEWISNSAKRYWDLYRSRDAPAAGIFQLGGEIWISTPINQSIDQSIIQRGQEKSLNPINQSINLQLEWISKRHHKMNMYYCA